MEREILEQIDWCPDENTSFYYGTIHIPEDGLELYQSIEWNGDEWVEAGDAYPDGWHLTRASDDCLRFILQKYSIPDTILPLKVIRTLPPKRLRSLSEAVLALGADRIQRVFLTLKSQGIIPITYLGGGGWGFVFHLRDGRQNIALKMLKPPYEQEWIQRFRREASILHKLSPKAPSAVVPSIDKFSDLLCIRMKLIEGRPLSDLTLPTTPHIASMFISEILRKLTPVHKAGIIHRDLHLGNVMVSSSGSLALVDFGLAREDHEAGASKTFLPVGTMTHCAPEKWLRPSQAGPQSDIFAVGVMLYKLLTGSHPFWADTYIELYELIKNGQFEPASSKNPNVPQMFDIALHSMLALDPDSRPPDASATLRIMEHIIALEKIRIRQNTKPIRKRTSKRYKAD